MPRVFIGIGSNEGDRLKRIASAVQMLNRDEQGMRVIRTAAIRETKPLGGPPQGPYLNTALELSTNAAPIELLRTLKLIEQQLGRCPSSERWAPRPIDLDLLLYDDLVINEESLTVPHERMHQRRFVLEPLAEIAPEVIHPVLRQSISTLLSNLPPEKDST